MRQPGGIRVKCEQGYGQTCDCKLFNNYGKPQTVSVGFTGFSMSGATSCSSQCGTLNDSTSDPGNGRGPFNCDFKATLGGIPNPTGSPIVGEFCMWQSAGVPMFDPVQADTTGVYVFFAIGPSSDGNGICAAVWVQGILSEVNYLVWTWKNLQVIPGLLGCDHETQVPFAYTINNLVGNGTSPTYWEWNGVPAAPDGQVWFCEGCSPIQPAPQTGAEAGAGCDGTAQTAPPCCCGGPNKNSVSLFACIKCNGVYCPVGLGLNGSSFTGANSVCGITASLSYSAAQWTLSWSGNCSGSYTFSDAETSVDPSLCLQSNDGNLHVGCGVSVCDQIVNCNCSDGQPPYGGILPVAVDIDPEGLVLGALSFGSGAGFIPGCPICNLHAILETDMYGHCFPLGATCELVLTNSAGICASYQFTKSIPTDGCGHATVLTVNAWLNAGCQWCASFAFSIQQFGTFFNGPYCSDPFKAADSPTSIVLKASPMPGPCVDGGGAYYWPCGSPPQEIKLEVLQ